ncbi:hypothetical protein WDU94_000680 [Cyamophila willieti]
MKGYVLVGLVLSVIAISQAKPLETNDADIAIGVNGTTSTTQISNTRTYFKETFRTEGSVKRQKPVTYREGNETFIDNDNDYWKQYDSEVSLKNVDTNESAGDVTQNITLYW